MDETVAFPGKTAGIPNAAAVPPGLGAAASGVPASTVTGDAQHRVATGVWQPETMAGLVPHVSGYEIISELGRGGMGVVYRARNVRLGHEVALKMILAGNAAGTQELARFQLEAVAVARLKHPGIVHLHEFGEHEGKPFFSLEFVEGGSLAGKLKAGAMPPRNAAMLVAKTARAMHHAHEQGIIHRDLKPANILLTRDDQPKVADFGLAKDLSNDDGLSRTGALMGTAAYMAPEQAEGRIREIRPTTDVYALGAILYECLTGRAPFKGTTLHETIAMVLRQEPASPRQITPTVPRDLETVCLRCLEKDPKKRYATAADLADDLERFLRGEPVAARPVGVLARGVRWCMRNRAVAASMAAVAMTLLLATIVSVFFGMHALRVADDEAQARKFASEQRDIAEAARKAKEAETIEKEHQRQEAVAATRARDAEIVKFRNALMNAQLLHVNQIWERDPVTAMRMLQDEVACPPEIRDFTWKLFRNMVQRDRFAWKNHTGRVTGLSSSPHGDMLASCGPDGIKVRDTATGRLIVAIDEPAEHIAFAPSGRALASTRGGRLTLRHIPSGKFAYTREAHTARIRALVFDPQGELLATSSLDKSVKVWDPDVGKLLDTFPGHDGDTGCLRFSKTPDGKTTTLMVSDGRLTTKVWNLQTKEAISWKGLDDGGNVVAISPNGKTLAFGGTQFGSGEVARLTLLPPKPEKPTQLLVTGRQSYLGHPHAMRAFAFNPDSRLLASLDAGGIVKVWDTKRETDNWDKDVEYVTLTDSATATSSIGFSADHERPWFATGGTDGIVRLWNLEPHKPRGLGAEKLLGWFFALAISPDSKTVAAANTDSSGGGPGQIQLWDRATGQAGKRFNAHIGHVWALTFSPNGNTLASGASDGKVILTDVATGAVRFTLTDKPGAVRSLSFNRDGSLLASAHEDGNVRVWDTAKGQLTATLTGHEKAVFGVAFHPDGRTLASGGADKTIRVWDVSENKQRPPIEGHPQAVWCVSFSPDGQTLASASDSTIKFWDVEATSLKQRSILAGHRARIWSIAFSPDGKTLASGAGDGFAGCETLLWDVLNGRPRGKLVSHHFEVRAVAFSPDGETLATSGFETLVYLWETSRRKLEPADPDRP